MWIIFSLVTFSEIRNKGVITNNVVDELVNFNRRGLVSMDKSITYGTWWTQNKWYRYSSDYGNLDHPKSRNFKITKMRLSEDNGFWHNRF